MGTGVVLRYQFMCGCGSDPSEEQFSSTRSPADTRADVDGVMNGPRGIAEIENFSLYKTFLIFPLTNHFQLDRPADGVENWELVAYFAPVDTSSVEIYRGYVDCLVGTVGKLGHN